MFTKFNNSDVGLRNTFGLSISVPKNFKVKQSYLLTGSKTMPKRKAEESDEEQAIKKLRGDYEPSESAAGPAGVGPEVKRQGTSDASSTAVDGFTVELGRLAEDGRPWRHWGPYLSERQWATVREDRSSDGKCWEYFTHDEAVYRTYTSGEDGLLGICDEQAQLCLALALWNGVDIRLKERLFGLSGPQGNHGEDVKEVYFYLDSTPSHSYMKALYKYPQLPFPYGDLVSENASRAKTDPEYELVDTGVFDESRYWDVFVEYAKSDPHDILCQYTVHNRGPDVATMHVLPTLWFRNTWSQKPEVDSAVHPMIKLGTKSKQVLCTGIESLGDYVFSTDMSQPQILFTNNETNVAEANKEIGDVITTTNKNHFKDSFHNYIIKGDNSAKLLRQGTKCAFYCQLTVPSGSMARVCCRLYKKDCPPAQLFDKAFEEVMNQRQQEADQFYNSVIPSHLNSDERLLVRQAYSGLCWSKQFYQFEGQMITSGSAAEKRNSRWRHLQNRDVISVPDKWEFPWYAPWDLAFQMLPFADIDLDFAKSQLLLFLSDRYQHPNGQFPGCEFNFSELNPPMHSWACLHLSRRPGSESHCDVEFLKRCFHRLTLNFNWWMNQKDVFGRFLFSGGFLGMDNISVFDRSSLPEGIVLEQADGTAWMAFYARCMMEMALELSKTDDVYETIAITFLRHFVSIAEAINDPQDGLWDEADGFFYDRAAVKDDRSTCVIRVRSLVGLVSLFPVIMLRPSSYDHLRAFKDELSKALERLKRTRPSAEENDDSATVADGSHLLSLVSCTQLKSLLQYLLDETEFLAPFGIRSLSKAYEAKEYSVEILGQTYSISYCPSDSDSSLFGGNSNWRGPIWLCMNYLLLEALDVYGNSLTDAFSVAFPSGFQKRLSLHKVTNEIRRRIAALFLLDSRGHRPLNGKNELFVQDAHWKGMVHFYEFYNPETGQGHGASHQTGWSALIASILCKMTSVESIQ